MTYFQKFFIFDRYLQLIRTARIAGFGSHFFDLFRSLWSSKRRSFSGVVLEFASNNHIFLNFAYCWGNFYILIRLLQLFSIKLLCRYAGESHTIRFPRFSKSYHFDNFFFAASRCLILFYRKILNAVFLVYHRSGPIKFPGELKNTDNTLFLFGLTTLSFSTLILLIFENCYWLTEKSGVYLQKIQAEALSHINIYSESRGFLDGLS